MSIEITQAGGDSAAYARHVGDRFLLASDPQVIARRVDASISLVTGNRDGSVVSAPLPYDEAYVFVVRLEDTTPYQLWINGQFLLSGELQRGSCSIFDLRTQAYASGIRRFQHVHFYMTKSFLDTVAAELGYGSSELVIPDRFAFNDRIMFHMAKSLVPVFRSRRYASTSFVDHLVNAAASHLISRYSSRQHIGKLLVPNLSASRLSAAMEMMEAHLDGDLALSKLAAFCGVSASEFVILFRQRTGTGVAEWLARRRTDKAIAFLRDSKKPIDEIARMAGYSDGTQMAASFMAVLGNPPEFFRANKNEFLRH
jgi:AraC-like DNA-binding protein